jgi:hypothetical protein
MHFKSQLVHELTVGKASVYYVYSLSLICFFAVKVVMNYVASIIFTILSHKLIWLCGDIILSVVMSYDIYYCSLPCL